jgi:hypothetical protein
MNPYYAWLIIFGIFAYFIAVDQSIAYVFTVMTKLLRFQYQKCKWWLFHNPRNIIVRWIMYRKSMRMAEELMKEFVERDK